MCQVEGVDRFHGDSSEFANGTRTNRLTRPLSARLTNGFENESTDGPPMHMHLRSCKRVSPSPPLSLRESIRIKTANMQLENCIAINRITLLLKTLQNNSNFFPFETTFLVSLVESRYVNAIVPRLFCLAHRWASLLGKEICQQEVTVMGRRRGVAKRGRRVERRRRKKNRRRVEMR